MRLFNELVFNGLVSGPTLLRSDPRFNELLGRARVLVFQVVVEDSSGTDPLLTVKYSGANDNQSFEDRLTVMNAVNVGTVPKVHSDEYGLSNVNDGFGMLTLAMDAAGKAATVKIYACGRD